MDFATARALLEWQIELGATEAIGDTPVNRYDIATQPQTKHAEPATPITCASDPSDPVAEAKAAAKAAKDLGALRDALDSFPHCGLRRGARTLVFADGTPGARVMIVGEAPGRDEDIQGKPFVGRAGQLLDRMFDAIGLDRNAPDTLDALYITNILPWRPPQNRDPEPEEIAMMLPFVERHIVLADPDFLVLMGNIACQGLLGRRGITKLRGTWAEVLGRPALPMFHPAYLLRNAARKSDAWHDLLMLKQRMNEG